MARTVSYRGYWYLLDCHLTANTPQARRSHTHGGPNVKTAEKLRVARYRPVPPPDAPPIRRQQAHFYAVAASTNPLTLEGKIIAAANPSTQGTETTVVIEEALRKEKRFLWI